MYTVQDRFLRYVTIDSQADPFSSTSPSRMEQLNMTHQVASELNELGIEFIKTEQGYIYATIPANTLKEVPKIFFCAHMDTAPDASGMNVKPRIHPNYQGEDITYPDDSTLVLNPKTSTDLSEYFGQDIITASGLTLLGADDKSGVAVIMDAAYQLINQPEIEHGQITLFFTTDEEIGKGVAHVDLDLLNSEYGYTLDSGPLGHVEQENFSADSLTLTITGVSAHPGYAKGKMENAIKIACEIIAALPKETMSPESTTDRQGFIHPTHIEGGLEQASIQFILRDFDTNALDTYENKIKEITEKIVTNYPNSHYLIERKMQYRNMYEQVSKHPEIIQTAIEAMKNVGIEPKINIIRGGTDGAMLTQLGLPCPNLFSGQHAIHSHLEWTSIQEMQHSVDTVVEICRLTAQNPK